MKLSDEHIGRLADLAATHARQRSIMQGRQMNEVNDLMERQQREQSTLQQQLEAELRAGIIAPAPPPSATEEA